MYGTPHPAMPWPSYTVSTCLWRSMAIDTARRTRTSLKGGRSCARARPKGASGLWHDCPTIAGLVLRNQHVGGVEVDAQRVLVRRLHAFDFLEGERLHALPRVGFETVLDVGGDEVPAVERRHVLPPDALAQLEGPDAVIGARRPGL